MTTSPTHAPLDADAAELLEQFLAGHKSGWFAGDLNVWPARTNRGDQTVTQDVSMNIGLRSPLENKPFWVYVTYTIRGNDVATLGAYLEKLFKEAKERKERLRGVVFAQGFVPRVTVKENEGKVSKTIRADIMLFHLFDSRVIAYLHEQLTAAKALTPTPMPVASPVIARAALLSQYTTSDDLDLD